MSGQTFDEAKIDPFAGLPLWFGPDSWCPATDDGTHVATPIGEACLWCLEAIEDGDSGYLRPYHSFGGSKVVAAHRECDFRSVMGGYNHVLGKCTCHGGTLPPDPVDMTKRQSAQAVWAHYNGADT